MLMLGLKVGEAVEIDGGSITLKVLRVATDKHGQLSVRLGVEAPEGVPVHRKEVWLRIQRDKEQQ